MTEREDLPDGVYFDLPHDEYLALPRLGSSSINDLCVSPATFWARSWMNPRRTREETAATALGTAYHMARLEPERFLATYARGFDASAFPDALRSDAEVCAWLAEAGETQRKKGETALERAGRARAIARERGEDLQVAAILEAQHSAAQDGKLLLASETWDDVEASMRSLRKSPEIAECLEGGFAEVTILWTLDGVPMRSRLDYLRPEGWTDLKSFSNPYGKPVDQCILDAFRFNRYWVQVALYDAALEEVRLGGVPIAEANYRDAGTKLFDFIEAIQGAPAPFAASIVFVESNGSGNILRRDIALRAPVRGSAAQDAGADDVKAWMTQPSRIAMKAHAEISMAIRRFKWAMEVYGPDEAWGPTNPVGTIGDEDFHDSFLDTDAR